MRLNYSFAVVDAVVKMRINNGDGGVERIVLFGVPFAVAVAVVVVVVAVVG